MPFLGKTCSVFGKTCSVFGKNMLRFWDEQAPFLGKIPFLGKKHAPFLGRTGSVFGTNWLRFLGKKRLDLRGNWFGFWIGLGQSSSLTVLNAKHVWVWIFEVLGRGVSKNKSTGGKLER